jgi:hypothetical protein
MLPPRYCLRACESSFAIPVRLRIEEAYDISRDNRALCSLRERVN